MYFKCLKIHGIIYKELCLHESWADEHGECSHKYVQLGAVNMKKAPFSEEIGGSYYVILCIK